MGLYSLRDASNDFASVNGRNWQRSQNNRTTQLPKLPKLNQYGFILQKQSPSIHERELIKQIAIQSCKKKKKKIVQFNECCYAGVSILDG